MAGIFVSYRREDSAPWAGRVYERLAQDFKRDQVLMDVDSIAPGLDFRRELERHVGQCDAVIAVIGKGWTDARNAQGQRRLDDPKDFVRIELEAALARDIRVIPVLVDGAKMPTEEELPSTLQALAYRNAVELTHARFGSDVQRLVEALKPIAAALPPELTSVGPPQPAPTVGRAREPVELSNLSPVARGVLMTLVVVGWLVCTVVTLAGISVLATERTSQPAQFFLFFGSSAALSTALGYAMYRLYRDRPKS